MPGERERGVAIIKTQAHIVQVDPRNLLNGDECWTVHRGGLEVRYYRRTDRGLQHWQTRNYDTSRTTAVIPADHELRTNLPDQVYMFLPADAGNTIVPLDLVEPPTSESEG